MNTSISFNKEKLIKSVSGVYINNGQIEFARTSLSHWVYTDESKFSGHFADDFASLSKEEFVRKAIELFKNAERNYILVSTKISQFNIYEYVKKMMSDHDIFLEKIKMDAEKKYKKEFYKNKYIEDTIKSYDEMMLSKIPSNSKEIKFTSFHFDSRFGSDNGISCFNTGSDEILRKEFEDIYERIINNPIISHFKGMKFVYRDLSFNPNFGCTPEFVFEMDKEGEEIVKHNKQVLADAITNFYKGCTYWGD